MPGLMVPVSAVGHRKPLQVRGRAPHTSALGKNINLCFEKVTVRKDK